MPFKHHLELVMGQDFENLMIHLRTQITQTGCAYDNWSGSYLKSPVIISIISNGRAEAIKTPAQVSGLYQGLLENYTGRNSNLIFSGLEIKEVKDHKVIYLTFQSPMIEEMRLEWASLNGFEIDLVQKKILIPGDDPMERFQENVELEFTLFSSRHLRSKGEFETIYNLIFNHIYSNFDLNHEFKSHGVKFVAKNPKHTPIQLW